MLESIILQLLKACIPVELFYNGDRDAIGYAVDGFYKSGTVTLYETNGVIEAVARYNEVTEITSIEDLVALNKKWWEYSKDMFSGWQSIEPKWLALTKETK